MALLVPKLVAMVVAAALGLGLGVVVGAQPGETQREVELDFQTEDVQRAPFNASAFTFTFARAGENTTNGNVRGQNVNNRPALATLPDPGVAQTLVTLGPCAINQPHMHPRATEFGFITQGEVLFAFLEENFSGATQTGGRYISTVIEAGNTFIAPQGLIHFTLNPNCEPAQFLASFPTRDPGTQTVLRSLFSPDVPNEVLRATAGFTDAEIAFIRAKVAANPNPSADPECLKRCQKQR